MCTYEIDPISDPRWMEFVNSHSAASVFHSCCWLQALEATYGYRPVAYTTRPPQSVLSDGLLTCEVQSRITGRRLISVPFADHCHPLVEEPESLSTLTASLCDLTARGHYKYLELRPRCSVVGMDPRLAASESFWMHTLELNQDLQNAFRSFHKDCVRRKIRRAEREHLRYESGRSEILLRQFYSLLIRTRRRHGMPPQPLMWFRNLLRCFGNCAQIRVACKDSLPVASIMTLRFKGTLVCKYNCSDERYARYGGTALLFWKAIEEATNDGLSEFDLGRSDLDDKGLLAFKDRWGTTRSITQYCRYPQQNAAGKSWPKRLPRFIVSHLPSRVLVTSGRLLYRHFA